MAASRCSECGCPFGRLPGDIAIEGENGGIYIPLGSMIVISLILTLILNFFVRR